MGGVQYSTYFLAEQLLKEKSAEVRIYLPNEGPFLLLCQKHAIPFTIYNFIPYTSTSISLFNDEYRIPNPFALIYNMCAILLNSVSIKKELKTIEKAVGKKFGNLKNPLLLSVRSGARVSMPGMMDTILNLLI